MCAFDFLLCLERSNDDIKYQVKKCHSTLTSSVDPKGHILSTLLQDSVITLRQSREISDRVNQHDRCKLLLDYLLEGVHPRSFILFRSSLLDEYGWLVEELDNIKVPKGESQSETKTGISQTDYMLKRDSILYIIYKHNYILIS